MNTKEYRSVIGIAFSVLENEYWTYRHTDIEPSAWNIGYLALKYSASAPKPMMNTK